MSAIEDRRRPAHDRLIRHSFSDQVPPVIEAFVGTLIAQALSNFNEHEADHMIHKIRDGLVVRHLSRREEFEQAFLRQSAKPCEVRIDWTTERVYLVGVGLPQREELDVVKRPVKDRYGNTQYYEKETIGEEVEGTLLTYTELSWRELRTAEERAAKLPPQVAQTLCTYFQITPQHLPAVLLALVSCQDDDLYGIARYALEHS